MMNEEIKKVESVEEKPKEMAEIVAPDDPESRLIVERVIAQRQC